MRKTLTARPAARTRRYDVVGDVGRFQLLTIPHLKIMRSGLDSGDTLAVVMGSDEHSRDLRNPLTSAEREEMIRLSLTDEENARTVVLRQRDVGNGKRWANQVQTKLYGLAETLDIAEPEIAIIGHHKDQTSAYLDDFEAFDLIEVDNIDNISATTFRDQYLRLEDEALKAWLQGQTGFLAKGAIRYLERFHGTEPYRRLQDEASSHDAHAKRWAGLPSHVVFNMGIAMIVQGTKVLMTPRTTYPGKGYWALPAAFPAVRQRLQDCAFDAALIGARLDVGRSVLERSLLETWNEDDPYRSSRDQTIGHVHLIHLEPRPQGRTAAERHASLQPPRVRGGADGARPEWKELSWIEANRSLIHEDNAIIIDKGFDRLARYIGR